MWGRSALGLTAGRNWSLCFVRCRSRLPGTEGFGTELVSHCSSRAQPWSCTVGTYTLVAARFLGKKNQGLSKGNHALIWANVCVTLNSWGLFLLFSYP